MLQVRSFLALILLLAGVSTAATQNTSSSRQAAMAEAKQASASHPARPISMPSNPVVRPGAVNRHALMTTQHPDVAAALGQANLPSSGKAHSFPGLSRANFLSAANARPVVFPESKAPKINTGKLRTTKSKNIWPLQ